MGIKRIVDVSFWTDGKVDDFSPEDKYFMLYLLTNPFTTQLGIYEISIKQAAFQMGYSVDTFNSLLERFEKVYKMIVFSKETNEVAIKNFLRHSIIKGGAPVRDCLIKEIKQVKNKDLIAAVFSHIKGGTDLNETVTKIIAEYERKNGSLHYSNEKHNDNDNDNDNDNEVSYPDTYNDSLHESFPPEKTFTDKESDIANKQQVDCQQIVNLYHAICKSYPTVRSLSDSRKKAIRARLKVYSLEEFKTVFENAESSNFLKGSNDRNWSANFDWLIKDSNMAKVLEGNYADKPKRYGNGRKEIVPSWCQERNLDNEEKEAIQRMLGNDPDLADRAEQLKQRLSGY